VGDVVNKWPKVQNNRIRQAGTINAYSPSVTQLGKHCLEGTANLENKQVSNKFAKILKIATFYDTK
jgi:hypothetical protein